MSSGIHHSLVNEMSSDKNTIFWEAVEREETQKKTFCKWVQFQLSRHPSPVRTDAVTDLYYDLRDGHVLLDLLEVIVKPYFKSKDIHDDGGIDNQEGTKNRTFSRVNRESDLWKREQGNLRVHQLANAGTVLNILRDSQHPFSKCVNINSVDIVDGNILSSYIKSNIIDYMHFLANNMNIAQIKFIFLFLR